MVRLGLAEAAGKRKLCIVGHLLAGEVEQRVGVHGLMQVSNRRLVERLRQVDAGDHGAEVRMDGLERQHWILPLLGSAQQPRRQFWPRIPAASL